MILGLSRSFCIHLHRSPSILEHSGAILNLEFSGVFEAGILGGILKHFGQAVRGSGPQARAQGPGPGLGPGPLGPSLWGQSRSHPMATGRRNRVLPQTATAPYTPENSSPKYPREFSPYWPLRAPKGPCGPLCVSRACLQARLWSVLSKMPNRVQMAPNGEVGFHEEAHECM